MRCWGCARWFRLQHRRASKRHQSSLLILFTQWLLTQLQATWKLGDGCADSEDIGRLATSVRAHSERTGVPVKLLIGIVMVENPWLDTLAVSRSGAVGLYQVMPMHTTAWPECEDALETIEGSTCRGASIFAWFLARGNERQSLLQYNGCYQDDCEGYPAKVWEEAESYSG